VKTLFINSPTFSHFSLFWQAYFAFKHIVYYLQLQSSIASSLLFDHLAKKLPKTDILMIGNLYPIDYVHKIIYYSFHEHKVAQVLMTGINGKRLMKSPAGIVHCIEKIKKAYKGLS
jgi:hypothetical protein